jgi:hypothetical protein
VGANVIIPSQCGIFFGKFGQARMTTLQIQGRKVGKWSKKISLCLYAKWPIYQNYLFYFVKKRPFLGFN